MSILLLFLFITLLGDSSALATCTEPVRLQVLYSCTVWVSFSFAFYLPHSYSIWHGTDYKIALRLSVSLSVQWRGVARICGEEGQIWKLCHGALTVDFRAGCSSCSMTNSFVTNAVLIERAVSC